MGEISERVRREYLDALTELYQELRKHDLDMGVFLSQSINMRANEDCVREITKDMRDWMEWSKKENS